MPGCTPRTAESWRAVPGHALLALVAHCHAPVGAFVVVMRAERLDDCACVVLGLLPRLVSELD